MEPNSYASAGRHMNQRFRSTVSATPQSTKIPVVNLVEVWMTESEQQTSEQQTSVQPETIPVDRTIRPPTPDSSQPEIDTVAQKMLLIDQRDLTHRRKRRVAATLVVSVITTIPVLLVALLFFV